MSKLNKLALLSISFILTTAYAIAPSIPMMMDYFPNRSEAEIQLLSTIPAFPVMIIVLFSASVTKLIGTKRTVQLGLLLVAIFGPLPMVLDNYYMILIARILLGTGFGLVNALAVSLISYFFDGKERATMMGFRSASESIGQSLLTLVAGYLIAWGGWRYSFAVYLIAIPIFLLFTFFVPDVDQPSEEVEVKDTEAVSKNKLNANIIFYAVALFFVVGSYVGIRVRIPLIVEARGMGTEIESGQILSMIPFLGLIIGIFFGQIYSFLKRLVLPMGTILVAIGYIVAAMSTSYAMLFVGSFIVGVGYPLIISGVFTFASDFAPKGSATFATSVILFGINMGAFLSPYLLQFIGTLTNSTDLVTPFYVYAGLLIIFGIFSYFNLKSLDSVE